MWAAGIDGPLPPEDHEWWTQKAGEIWDWCEAREWKVRLGTDHDGDWDEWLELPITGTRYDESV